MNQQFNDLSANEAIYEAIRQIALHKLVNPKNNVIKNTSRISGYVTKIHTDENDELYGTVDVQEYNDSLANNQAKDEGLPVGLHEGVFLSAIQNNDNGLITIPYLNSDVVIATDPDTLKEYVVAYSHADTVQIDTHTKTIIGVTETKEFEESEDSPDVDQLEISYIIRLLAKLLITNNHDWEHTLQLRVSLTKFLYFCHNLFLELLVLHVIYICCISHNLNIILFFIYE